MKDSTINASTWLNNILPAPKGDTGLEEPSSNSRPTTPSKPESGSAVTPPAPTPQKPVNLLPEVPNPTTRKLTDREQRDCDVIGNGKNNFIFLMIIKD